MLTSLALRAAIVAIACHLAAAVPGWAQLTDAERARPAFFARRHMLAQQAAREKQTPAVLDTMPITESAGDVIAFINRVGVDSAQKHFLGTAVRGTLCGLALADRIGTGDSLWLAVAQRIAGATVTVSICNMYSLRQAVQEALANAPERVLRLIAIDKRFEFDWTCADMISYDLENRPRMDALNEAHRAKVKSALMTVRAPGLRKLVQACAGRLLHDEACEPSEIRVCPEPLPTAYPADSLADSFLRTVAARGIDAGVARLMQIDVIRPTYRARIARGDSIWLAIAAVVAKQRLTSATYKNGVNTSWAFYDIMDAFADALVAAPQRVLEVMILYPYLQLGWTCEGGTTHAVADLERADTRRLRAGPPVRAISAPEFSALRDMCVARLRR